MPSISDRLLEERARLGLTQPTVAELCGVTIRTQRNYETGERAPDAHYLAAFAQAGADVRYVVTGRRDYVPPPPLSPEEQLLVQQWREASREVKSALLGALSGVGARHTHQEFKGPVGSVLSTSGGSHTFSAHMDAGTYAPKPPAKKKPGKP